MSAFQGFDIKLNLEENSDDRDALNNLGTAPIADDITLFLNNLRNTSELVVSSTDIQGSFISFNPEVQGFVFTNSTNITVDSTEFFVGDSNGINEFRLYTDQDLTDLVTTPPVGVYERTDAVTSADISNLVTPRSLVVENIALSQVRGADDSTTQNANIFASYIQIYGGSIASRINSIDQGLDLFSLRKQKSINTLTDFESTNGLSLSGNILVSDPDGVNNTSVSSASGPGIFILDPATNNATRIFSSNENVWTEDGADLVAASEEIVVGNFVFNDAVRLLQKGGTPEIVTEQDLATEFTHFATVIVNGEEYSLCLK
jgi:hypothetical protein